MNKITVLVLIAIVFLSDGRAQSEPEFKMNEIIISASRVPLTFSGIARSVTVFDTTIIKNIPVSNVLDLLKFVGSVDVKTRGVEGVQGDISIRGGTSEQTLIMINGIKLSDPQTSHHNLNIPVILENIERVEILKGQGSRIFGPNAFSGAVNIITKKNLTPSLNISAIGGEHNLFEVNISANCPAGITGNTISFSKKKSDGYSFNTDFDITNFLLQQNILFGSNSINLMFGYDDKKFGANSFYSNLFPNQWEHTTTKLLSGTTNLKIGDVTLSPKIYWRRNNDDFFLDHNRPDWNRNIHQTNSYGGEIQSSFKSSIGITSFGGEVGKDEITSSNLGNHQRNKGGFFAEQVLEPGENISTSVGFFIYNYSGIGWKFWPGIDAAYRFDDHTKLFASIGKAFRIPTFTDLYYKSPANIGNPGLTYEETINYEIGFSLSQNNLQTNTSVFLKDGKNLIDWVRPSRNDPWIVQNLTRVKTYGFEISSSVDIQRLLGSSFLQTINISYTYLTADRITGDYESKYLLDHLRHQLIFNVTNNLVLGIFQSWSIRYEDRQNYQSYFLVDTQLMKRIGDFDLMIRATNLFNKSYSDFSGVMLPGRWISAGVKYSYM
jgi:iron complex outermembrane receptor protein